MAIWLNRAGGNGEYESFFLDSKKIYLTWSQVDLDLRNISSKQALNQWYETFYGVSRKAAINYASQLWSFLHNMKIGDIVVLPSKRNSTIHFGYIRSDVIYDETARDIYRHSRTVEWFAPDVPRNKFDQDLLYSFGAFSTICEIKRNDAEKRIRKMIENGWNSVTFSSPKNHEAEAREVLDDQVDLEQYSLDLIAKFIERKLKGYQLQNLVAGILEAKGYKTFVPSEGADEGVDILAGKGDLGFQEPSICVQVKSTDAAVDRPTLDQLIGTMTNFKANYGILVSWSGFKSSVEKARAKHYFKVKLWDQKVVIQELLNNYNLLSEEIKSMIPLKQIWTLTNLGDYE